MLQSLMHFTELLHNYIFLTFLALAILTTFNILSNVFTQKSQDQKAFAIIFDVFASIFALLIFFLIRQNQNYDQGYLFAIHFNTTNTWLLLIPILTIILYTIADTLRFIPTKHLAPSTKQITGTFLTIISVTMSYFIYNDIEITLLKILGIILIIALNIILAKSFQNTKKNITNRKSKHIKYLLISIFVYTLFGIAGGLDKMSSKIIGVEAYNLLVWILPTIFMFIFAFPSVKNIPNEIKKVGIFKIAFLAFLNVTMYFTFLKALQYGPAFNVLAILGLVNITTFLAESIFLKHKVKNKLLQGILALLSTIGVVLIVR